MRLLESATMVGRGARLVGPDGEAIELPQGFHANISRPHLIKQLDAGELAFHLVGTHRRLRLVDVLAYQDRVDAAAEKALAVLSDQAEELGLYEQ